MKVLALNGSSNAKGVTYTAMNLVGEELTKEGIEMEIMHVGAKGVQGCTNCKQCRKTHHCVINDKVNEIIVQTVFCWAVQQNTVWTNLTVFCWAVQLII